MIGNPLAVARGFTEGVESVIYEPIAALQKGGAKKFFKGLLVGAENFTAKTVG